MLREAKDTVTSAFISILLVASLLIPDCAARSYLYLYAKEDPQYIYSYGYPNTVYQSLQDDLWIITAYHYQSIVVAEVVESALEVSHRCKKDYLQFYDGKFYENLSLGKYCGTAEPTVRSTGDTLIIHFKTDLTNAYKGFKIKYYVEKDPYVRFLQYFGISLGIIISVISMYIICKMCCSKKKKCCTCCSRCKTSVHRIHTENNRREQRWSEDNDTEIWTATIAMRRLTSREVADRSVTHPPHAVPTQPPPYTPRDFTLAGYTSAVEINPDEPPTSPPPAYSPQMDLDDCTNPPGYVNNGN